jgi:hypothetical protein
MRNPWARETYNGPWNDSYEGWTAPMRKKLKFIDQNDGVFYIPIEIFKETFSAVYIAMYQNWNANRWYVGRKEHGQHFTRYAISKIDQTAFVTIDWMAKRKYPPKHCEGMIKKHDYNILITDMSTEKRT